jgi:hypothetical protein
LYHRLTVVVKRNKPEDDDGNDSDDRNGLDEEDDEPDEGLDGVPCQNQPQQQEEDGGNHSTTIAPRQPVVKWNKGWEFSLGEKKPGRPSPAA